MKHIVKVLTVLIMIIPVTEIFAQGGVTEAPNHDVFERTENENREKLDYVHVREADVMWHKTMWRRIDMRQKFNLPFYYPFQPKNGRKNFMTTVKEAIEQGELTVYKYNLMDDEFTEPLSIEEAMQTFTDSITRVDYDDDGNEITVREAVDANMQDIYELDIKEQWFIDRERSVLDVRIIGIAPVWQQPANEENDNKTRKPMFWIYYPAARDVFINSPVYNPKNDAERLTYEDLFAKRMFDSYIYKESNVYDREIADYALGMEALLEAKRIKKEVREREMNLWEY
ncbi:MAG: gliding motility protein GldN [Bacteroidales bacterium]